MNALLRRVGSWVSPRNPIRRAAAAIWRVVLSGTGRHVDVRVAGEWLRLRTEFRSFTEDYEAATMGVLLRLLRPGDVFWDVGANIGIVSLLAARRVGGSGRVIAWEPSASCAGVLADHVAANGLSGLVELRREAMAGPDAPPVLRFQQDAGMAMTSRVVGGGSEVTGSVVEVPTTHLDRVAGQAVAAPGGRLPSVVKIDIEGAEAAALDGAVALMSGRFGPPPAIIVGVHPKFLRDLGRSPEELPALAAKLGCRSHRTDGSAADPVEYEEYVLLPEARLAELTARAFPPAG